MRHPGPSAALGTPLSPRAAHPRAVIPPAPPVDLGKPRRAHPGALGLPVWPATRPPEHQDAPRRPPSSHGGTRGPPRRAERGCWARGNWCRRPPTGRMPPPPQTLTTGWPNQVRNSVYVFDLTPWRGDGGGEIGPTGFGCGDGGGDSSTTIYFCTVHPRVTPGVLGTHHNILW